MSDLDVWMNGELVGRWSENRGAHTLTYDADWVTSPRGRALSLSLPITTTLSVHGEAVRNYFDNLLPDSPAIRERVQRRYRTRSTDVFELLTVIGRDCVGAVQLLSPGTAPEDVFRIDSEPLSDEQVEEILRDVTAEGPIVGEGDPDDFRISIAGAQEKTALLKVDDQWHRPRGATPTTHILKLPLGIIGGMRLDMTHSIENEWLCLRLLGLLGLPVAKASIGVFGSQKALVVERFDRALVTDPHWIARLPQEDFCQATGHSPDHKYEEQGGPGIARSLQLLAGSRNAAGDQATFLLTQLAFWMLAATDGHAKNFSIFHESGGTYSMTPLYDVLSMWPIVGIGANLRHPTRVKMAMAVRSKNPHYRMVDIQPRHWVGLAQKSGLPRLLGEMRLLAEGVETALDAAKQTLPAGFPVHVWDAIAAGLTAQSRLVLTELMKHP